MKREYSIEEKTGRTVSKLFSPSVIIPGGAVMENKYVP